MLPLLSYIVFCSPPNLMLSYFQFRKLKASFTAPGYWVNCCRDMRKVLFSSVSILNNCRTDWTEEPNNVKDINTNVRSWNTAIACYLQQRETLDTMANRPHNCLVQFVRTQPANQDRLVGTEQIWCCEILLVKWRPVLLRVFVFC